jgi:hypothetical protein
MNILFKIVTSPAPSLPTVGDTNFKDHYPDINQNMSWAEMLPTVRTAAEQWLVPFVGEELYADMVSKVTTNATLSAEQGRTLELMRDALANYTVYKKMPDKAATVAALGVVQNTPDGGSQPASQWAFREKRLAALANADSALDRLLAYLEKQTATYFDLWKTSSAATYKRADFFGNTLELGEYLNIKESRRSFVSIVPFLRRAEQNRVKAVLCDTLYDSVVSAPTATLNAPLVPYIKEAVAYLGAAVAVPHHRVVVDGDGFRVVSQTDGFEDRRNLTNSVHESAVGSLIEAYTKQGEAALARLLKYLEDNLAVYPDYENSDCRKKPAERGHSMYQSPSGTGAVGLF